MSIVCGTTAGAADSKILNQPITFESNRLTLFESSLEASQVPTVILIVLRTVYSL